MSREVEARELTADNGAEIAAWSGGTLRGGPGGGSNGGSVILDTPGGRVVAEPGDYVMRGLDGVFYPCQPSAAAARDASRVDQSLQARQLPAVPAWVQDPAKWATLSRADRRALERHHKKVGRRG